MYHTLGWEKVVFGGGGPGQISGHTCNSRGEGAFIYVFGGCGNDGRLTNRLHILNTATLCWEEPTVIGTPPTPRTGHSCTIVNEDLLFVFGGRGEENVLMNDLHIFRISSNEWIAPPVEGFIPRARHSHSATFIGRCLLFIFGGATHGVSYDNSLYVLNTDTCVWQRLVTYGTPPSARVGHTATVCRIEVIIPSARMGYNTTVYNSKIIVFGGYESLDSYELCPSHVYIFDPVSHIWTKLKIVGRLLPPRAMHTSFGLGEYVFIFGGSSNDRSLHNDIYKINIRTGACDKVITIGVGPHSRFGMAGCILGPSFPFNDWSLVFIGGCVQINQVVDDMYYLHSGSVMEMVWGEVQVNDGPGRVWGHTCNAIAEGKLLYIFGGNRDDARSNQIHVLDTVNMHWSNPIVLGQPPTPRDNHSCTTVGQNLVVFGGSDGRRQLNDIHIFKTYSNRWVTPFVLGHLPEPREGHGAVHIDRRLLIFGGRSILNDNEVLYNDVYAFNTDYYIWQPLNPIGVPPSARFGHTFTACRKKIIVVGGQNSAHDYLADIHILDTERVPYIWSELETFGEILSPRAGHTSICLANRLLIFGGFSDHWNFSVDLHIVDFETAMLSRISTIGVKPSSGVGLTAQVLEHMDNVLIFIGGRRYLEPLDEVSYLLTGIVDGAFEKYKHVVDGVVTFSTSEAVDFFLGWFPFDTYFNLFNPILVQSTYDGLPYMMRFELLEDISSLILRGYAWENCLSVVFRKTAAGTITMHPTHVDDDF